MTNRMRVIFSKAWLWWFLALLSLAGNRFVLSPQVGASAGQSAGNYVFVLVRVLLFFLLSLLLVRLSGFRRFRALSALGILVAVEHVGFNLVSILSSYRVEPGQYPEGLAGPLFGLLVSYMIGLPFVLLIGFLGSSLGSRR